MSPKAIYGLVGYPVEHSLSKKMQEAAFSACGIAAEYRLIPVRPEQLQDFLLKNLAVADIDGKKTSLAELAGFNITIPHKIKAKAILEEKFKIIEDTKIKQQDLHYVKVTDAVNTVKNEAGNLLYWNTDAAGFLQSLKDDLKFNTINKTALIVGCGGAGRAVIAALSWRQEKIAKLYVYDNTLEARESARKHFDKFDYIREKLLFIDKDRIGTILKDCQLLINASPLGMKDNDPSPIDKNLLHKDLYICDVIYNRKTQLIKDAEELDLAAKGGLGMLLYQGAAAFELWTGQSAPIKDMRRALEEEVRLSM